MTHKHQKPHAAADLVATGDPATVPTADLGQVAHVADDIAAQLARVQAEVAELKDAWLRAKAETDNARKIGQADVAKAHKYAIERFAEDLLPVKDALEQTLAAGDVSLDTLKSGAELTLKALRSAFDRAQVVELNPVGEKFDPHRHQAMQMVPSDQPANTVVDVFQKGYLVNDRVLRPALVSVSSGGAQTS
jgi:molecular chaperone GrpE